MKILYISAILFLLCLFVGCGEEVKTTTESPEDKTPDVATLTGKATLEGENDHSGVKISLYRGESLVKSSETDAGGSYSIGLKKTGDYTLKFEKDGFVTATQEITIAEGENSATAVTLDPGGTIVGTVNFEVQPQGKPQLKITITNEADGQKFIVEADRNGKYLLTVLPGSYTIIVEDTTPDSKFSPFKQEGVEIKVGDIIAVEALLSTWPYFEAEGATVIKGLMKVEKDPAASEGKYIVGAGDGYARFDIMVPEDGNYIIWGRVSAKDGGSDSFFVGVNIDDPGDIWDVQHGTWIWDRVSKRGGADPVIFKISKGKNSITFKTREVNTKLDKIFLTTSSSARP